VRRPCCGREESKLQLISPRQEPHLPCLEEDLQILAGDPVPAEDQFVSQVRYGERALLAQERQAQRRNQARADEAVCHRVAPVSSRMVTRRTPFAVDRSPYNRGLKFGLSSTQGRNSSAPASAPNCSQLCARASTEA
jgi:hypothetical protein